MDKRSTPPRKVMQGTPAGLGFRMPGPERAHRRTWMAWPHRADLYGERLARIQAGYAEVARAIARFEPVVMVVHPDHVGTARRLLDAKVEIVPIVIDDAWIRDSGPTFLAHPDGRIGGVSWRFNAWGGKHAPFEADDALAGQVLDHAGAEVAQSFLVCEGGSLTTDGDGTLICTETSILHPNRNPGISKAWAELELKRMLGMEKVVWLPGDPFDAETDGHIDGMCCAVGPGKVLFEVNPDPADPHARILADNLAALKAQTDARGRPFEVLTIEDAVDAPATSDVFCRSYINFYKANGGIVLPTYGLPSDDRAADSLRAAFPNFPIERVDVSAIAPGGGSIHCITQEEPR
jgi:agmatine deiminase